MATNLAINQKLLQKAQTIGHHDTKRETVNVALEEYIRHHEQKKILIMFNKVEYDKNYDYKKARKKTR